MSQTTFTNGTASGTIEYTNDTIGLTQVLVSDDGAGQEIYQLYGNSLIGQQKDGAQFQTFITDSLGSVRVERETSGATNYTRTFSPFGETLSETGTSSSVYGYTGQQEDDSTGLIYLRARYYSAELKAFTAYDVWPGESRRPQSLNHYAYVEGNPINFSEPSGYCSGSLEHQIDSECWNYLQNEFCNEVECQSNDWKNWLLFDESKQSIPLYSGHPVSGTGEAFSKFELKVLAQDIQHVINALRDIGIEWKSTPILEVRFQKTIRENYFNGYDQVIRLQKNNILDGHSTFHELGHSLEFPPGYGIWGIANIYAGTSRIGELAQQFDETTYDSGIICTIDGIASEGYYYRQYGYDFNGKGNEYPLNRKQQTWADAFAAFVYMEANKKADGSFVYPNWETSLAWGNLEDYSKPSSANYHNIYRDVKKVLQDNY